MKIIKSNTWKENTNFFLQRSLSGKPTDLRMQRTDAKRQKGILFVLATLGIIAYMNIWIGLMAAVFAAIVVSSLKLENVPLEELRDVEVLTKDSATSTLEKLGWSLAGGAIFGLAGYLSGAIGAGNKSQVVAVLAFTGDRKALVKGKAQEIEQLSNHCVQF